MSKSFDFNGVQGYAAGLCVESATITGRGIQRIYTVVPWDVVRAVARLVLAAKDGHEPHALYHLERPPPCAPYPCSSCELSAGVKP